MKGGATVNGHYYIYRSNLNNKGEWMPPYLHTDGVWRESTLNYEHNYSGYFRTKAAALKALDKKMAEVKKPKPKKPRTIKTRTALYLVYTVGPTTDPEWRRLNKMPHCINFITDDKAWAKEYCEYIMSQFGNETKMRIKTLTGKQLCLTKKMPKN